VKESNTKTEVMALAIHSRVVNASPSYTINSLLEKEYFLESSE